MIQALQVFARAVDQETLIDFTQYAELRPRIEASIPHDIEKELHKAVVRKLEYANGGQLVSARGDDLPGETSPPSFDDEALLGDPFSCNRWRSPSQ